MPLLCALLLAGTLLLGSPLVQSAGAPSAPAAEHWWPRATPVPRLPAPRVGIARLSGARAITLVVRAWPDPLPPALLPRPGMPNPPHPGPEIRWSMFFITGYTDRGLTFTGTQARYGEVAVDPRVIPLGAWLQLAGVPTLLHAEDTGGLVKGERIDVWLPTPRQCFAITGWKLARWSRHKDDLT